FLHDLLKKVIFAESGWVTRDMTAVRRAAVLRYGVLGIVGVITLGVLGVWAVSYTANRQLIASTNRSVDEYRVLANAELKRTTIDDVNLEAVLEPLHQLRSMAVGYLNRDAPTPTSEKFGLSQRPRLVSAAETSYREALERMFRSRLILRLEQQIEAVMDDPIALYEALKVYLMLGGNAPKIDRDLIATWMTSDWQTNLYPGAANSAARVDLEQHLEAMLDLGIGQRPTFELNGPLIENAQRALARMNIADRAYALIRSTGYSAEIEDWVVVQRGGPDTALVFETIDGTPIEELRIPGLFTYSGFHDFYLDQLAAVADRLIEDQWVMGEVGQQQAVEEQFSQLGPQLLDRYRNDFIESWEKVLTNIRFRQLSADKPQYQILSALSAPTSPLRQIIQSIRDETVLTEERQQSVDVEGVVAGVGSVEQSGIQNAVMAEAARRLRDRSGAFSRIGIDLALRKAQGRAGGAFGGTGGAAQIIPGANIEAFFKPWQMMVDGPQGQRPIDSVVQNFYEVYQNLVLSATNPSQAERANAALQVNVVGLRANASRLPRPLAVMVQSAAEDFEGDAAGTSIAQLTQMMNSTVTRTCQQIAANRYPFDKASERDVTLSDFARLFAPDGIIDRFFVQNLAPLADMSGETWIWKSDSRVGREMSNATLRDFQRAAEIRDAFFPTGGSMPNVQLTVQPNTLSGDAEMALLEINGTFITSRQIGNLPASLTWPGATTGGAANITILPELPGRDSSVARNGPWALMRVLDAGSVSPSGDDLTARFVIGGREVSYRFEMGTAARPLANPALSQFKCPAGL
ncbi:MAG: type VI secretion system membrane subunit TssM, partial [Rhizobiaceae bacterium]|nr:type VI secretion system membrane subunit TssM [Rhizobiaceae bacterium]